MKNTPIDRKLIDEAINSFQINDLAKATIREVKAIAAHAEQLSGVEFQRRLEEKSFALGNGKIPQQLFGDYCENKKSTAYGTFSSETRGETAFANLRGLFSDEMEQSFIEGMHSFAKHIPDFDRKDAIISGVESRTSSPVRIRRDEVFEANIRGIYPCGEGAGYAGGITSAAMDGMKVAEAVIRKYQPFK
jgi:uncharacterized FAD-dependent dehydrogenase